MLIGRGEKPYRNLDASQIPASLICMGIGDIIEAELPAAKNEATIWSGSAFPSMWKKQSGSGTGRSKGGNGR